MAPCCQSHAGGAMAVCDAPLQIGYLVVLSSPGDLTIAIVHAHLNVRLVTECCEQ